MPASGVQQSDSAIHIHTHTYTHIYSLCTFSSIIGYHRVLSTAACTTQHVTVGRLLHTQQCVYILIPKAQAIPPKRQQPQVCFLCLWVYFCFVNKFICVLFFFFKILHINDALWYLSFSVWLTSVGMIISKST